MSLTTVLSLLLVGGALRVPAAAAGGRPTISSFAAVPTKVTAGQSSSLKWSVTGATSITISPDVGAVTGTSVTVMPPATTAYTLTATNSVGSTVVKVTVSVGSLPVITSFTATPATLAAGRPSTLDWTATGATAYTINGAPVTGASLTVKPAATTPYTLTASNTFGSAKATVTLSAGAPPSITSFKATPARVTPGQPSTLSWTASGYQTLSMTSGVGAVTGSSLTVTPATTTSYTLTATNNFGTVTATVTVSAGSKPAIVSFTASPTKVTAGQSATLSWAVAGATGLAISPGVGAVTGTSTTVTPTATTTYTLTATNSSGSVTATATATIVPASPPVISSFFANPATGGPGVGATLHWAVSGATNVSLDHGIGTVTGNSATVNPSATTTYTLTATNGAGTVTATTVVSYIPLASLSSQLYYTEHALFLIPTAGQVTWTGSNSWGSVFSTANVDSYVATLKSYFPDDYFFVVVAANNLLPNDVPSVQPLRRTADGIGLGSTGVGVPSICRYNIGGNSVVDGAFAVLDHEIGHNWGVSLQPLLSDDSGHWYANSTAAGQMAGSYSDDGYLTVKQIAGTAASGFTWAAVDNIVKNETETFSLQDLYLQGLNPTFPDVYVLTSPVYNADHTVSYSSVAKYDQAWFVLQYGARNPTYQTSPKRLRTGFVYVARDLAEVQAVYQPIERSISHFVNAEQVDTTKFRFQVPFLVDTQYRASLDALLADLDGNATPKLSIPGSTSLRSSDGTAVAAFTASDADGPAPTVSCVPASINCGIQGSNVVLTGLATGTHFFTIKAEDSGGKKAFAHFVVDVQ